MIAELLERGHLRANRHHLAEIFTSGAPLLIVNPRVPGA
jgi:hypothetical protein